MLVEPGMRDEWGGDLAKVADLLGEDEVGVKVDIAEIGDLVRLTIDSTTVTGSKHVYLDPVSADELADLLKMRAREARGL